MLVFLTLANIIVRLKRCILICVYVHIHTLFIGPRIALKAESPGNAACVDRDF